MELLLMPFFWGCILPATAAAYNDLKSYRLPNILTVPILIVGLVYGVYTGHWQGTLLGITAALIAGLPGIFLNQLGMGDVKLMAGIGAWVGPLGFMAVLFISCILGVIWSVLKLFKKHEMPRAKHLPDDGVPVPPNVIAFGFCLALGLWIYILLSMKNINIFSFLFQLLKG